MSKKDKSYANADERKVLKLIDSHAYLDFDQFHGDFEEVLNRAKDSGVFKIINIGADVEGSRDSVFFAENHNEIYATAGIHPDEASKIGLTEGIKLLDDIVKSSRKVVAIGECGLDYYGDPDKAQREKQRMLFEAQIELAQKHRLPLVIHIRNGSDNLAFEDAVTIIRDAKASGGVIHCFTFGHCEAEEILKLGFSIGFTGIITYKNAENIREAVKATPIEKILVETDCPFLAPQGNRGKRNEPAYVVEIAEKIAELKNLRLEEVAAATTRNAESLFSI